SVPARLEIVSARFGVLSPSLPQCVDVTDELRAATRDGTLLVTATNDLGGDPARNIPKSLFVQYTVDGETRTARIAELKTLTLPPTGVAGPIEVTAALYGNIPEKMNEIPQRVAIDVTGKIRALVEDDRLSVRVGNELVGE